MNSPEDGIMFTAVNNCSALSGSSLGR